MSENIDNTETENKTRGQRPKTEEELRQLFAECVETINAEGLMLKVDEKRRCSVIHVDGDQWNEVIPPVAGNTFARLLEGAKRLAPYAG